MFRHSFVPFFLSAALLLSPLSMTGCGRKNNPVKTKPTNVYQADVLMETVKDPSAEASASTVDLQTIYGTSGAVIAAGYAADAGQGSREVYYSFDTDTGEPSELSVVLPEIEGGYRLFFQFADDGTIWYAYSLVVLDEETQSYRPSVMVYHTECDGTPIAERDLFDLLGLDPAEPAAEISTIQVIGTSLYLGQAGYLYVVSPDLSEVETIALDFSEILKILPTEETLRIAGYSEKGKVPQMVSYDDRTGQLSDPMELSVKAKNHLEAAMPSDTYDFVYSDQIAVYGYDIAADTAAELLNWVNSDIDTENLRSTYVAPNGTVYTILSEKDGEISAVRLLRLTRIPDDQIPEQYLLTYGALYIDRATRQSILNFNKHSTEYRIVIRDYSEYNSEENNYNGAQMQFDQDIITGNIPDIIAVHREMPYQNYAAKGLFADLRPMLEQDESIAAGDVYENILNAYTVNGRVCALPASFSIQTIIGKSSLVGDIDGWTSADMEAAGQKLVENGTVFHGDMTRDQYLTNLCTLVKDQFINRDTGVCSFDSSEFIRILTFADTLPEKTIFETTKAADVGPDFWKERDFDFRRNKALLMPLYLSSYTHFWETQQGAFGEPVSFVGYPNERRCGSAITANLEFAISENSPCKEGAWAFISTMIHKFADQPAGTRHKFSILRSANQEMADYALSFHDGLRPSKSGEEASESEDMQTWMYRVGDEKIDIGRMTQESVDHVNALLESLTQVSRMDEAMIGIIREEASAFFAGQKSAQEVAKLIQSRVSIYVNESR